MFVIAIGSLCTRFQVDDSTWAEDDSNYWQCSSKSFKQNAEKKQTFFACFLWKYIFKIGIIFLLPGKKTGGKSDVHWLFNIKKKKIVNWKKVNKCIWGIFKSIKILEMFIFHSIYAVSMYFVFD